MGNKDGECGGIDGVVDMHGGEGANVDGDSGCGWEWEIWMRMGNMAYFLK